jgi:hypothetical protein
MEQSQRHATEPVTEQTKKPYNTPALQVYGDLRQITQANGKPSSSDNARTKQRGATRT